MAANGGDPLGKILIAIGMVREEIAGLRGDLLGQARVSSAAGQGEPPRSMPAAAAASRRRWLYDSDSDSEGGGKRKPTRKHKKRNPKTRKH